MLASEISSTFRVFLKDYQNFRIIELLAEAINLLAQKGKINEAQYVQQADSILNRAMHIHENNLFQHQPDRLRRIVSQSAHAKVTPSKIATILLNGINHDQNEGMSSSELKLLYDIAIKANNDMSSYINILESLGIHSRSVVDSDITIVLYVPSVIYEDNLGVAGDRLAKYDKFVDAISDLLPNKDKPRLVAISDGSIFAILVAELPTLIAIAKAWSAVMQAAADTLKFKSALDTMKSVGMQKDVVEAQSQLIDQRVIADLHQRFYDQFAESFKIMPESDGNAARSKLEMTANIMVEDAKKGLRLSLEVSAKATRETLISPEDPLQVEIAKLIENQKALELQMTRLLDKSGPPPQLTSPENQ